MGRIHDQTTAMKRIKRLFKQHQLEKRSPLQILTSLRGDVGDPFLLTLINKELCERRTLALQAQKLFQKSIDKRWSSFTSSAPPTKPFPNGSRVVFGFPSHDPRALVFEPRDGLGRMINWLFGGSVGTLLWSSENGTSHLVQFDLAPVGSPSLVTNWYLVGIGDLH